MDPSVLKKRKDVIVKSSRLFYYQGYVNTGISEILKVCKIPKGSFYYYFKNKENLLDEVIDLHVKNLLYIFDEMVDDLSMVKLRSFFFKYFSNILDNDCHGGSLLGNLAIEMSDINDEIRSKIEDSYRKLEVRLMMFLKLMHDSNPRYVHINPEIFSKVLINQMEGTMLKLKVSKDKEEIETFFKLFDYLMYKNVI